MNYMRQFLISFGGLKLGNHQFHFEIDDKFFEEFEYSEYKTSLLDVLVELEKQQRMLIFNFIITGNIEVVCDRCLDPLPLPINGNYKLFVKFGTDSHEESDDVVFIPENETRFNIAHFIYEYIILSVPIRHVHPENIDGTSGCDQEVIKKLQEMNSVEKNDPRWDVLTKLKN